MRHKTLLAIVICVCGISCKGNYNSCREGILSCDLKGGDSLILRKNYSRLNTTLIAEVEGYNSAFLIGRGAPDTYGGYWLKITTDSVYVYSHYSENSKAGQWAHGLHIGRSISVEINTVGFKEMRAQLTLRAKDSSFEKTIPWWGGGRPIVKNIGKKKIKVDVSYLSNSKQDVWLIGDSYMSYPSKNRWTYYLLNAGYDKVFIDAQPGAKSEQMLQSLTGDLLLETQKPKYIIWGLGMNDASDITTYDNIWYKCITEFLSLYNTHNITPVLCTIPSVPTINHEKKNEWIRNSGYRYIDFAFAVEEGKSWKENALSTDGIHPTEKGAMLLYQQFLSDFPEMEILRQ